MANDERIPIFSFIEPTSVYIDVNPNNNTISTDSYILTVYNGRSRFGEQNTFSSSYNRFLNTTSDMGNILYDILTQSFDESEEIKKDPEQQIEIAEIEQYRDTEDGDESTPTCSICIVNFEEGESVGRLNCSHIFHENCIREWGMYNPKCPVCRAEIPLKNNI